MLTIKMKANMPLLSRRIEGRNFAGDFTTINLDVVLEVLHYRRGVYNDVCDGGSQKACRVVGVFATHDGEAVAFPFIEGEAFPIKPFEVRIDSEGEPHVYLSVARIGGNIDNRGSDANGFNQTQLNENVSGSVSSLHRVILWL